VLFSCLVDGLDKESRSDAAVFFNMLSLRDMHIIDSFARPGFWKELAEDMEANVIMQKEPGPDAKAVESLKFLEMSYTYRGHSDPDFMARLCGEELPDLLSKGLVAASFNLAPPPTPPPAEEGQEALEDPANLDEQGELIDNKRPEGILPFQVNSRASLALRKRFEQLSTGKKLADLKMLNLSMWTLRPEEVGEVLYSCAADGNGSLADLCVSVSMEAEQGGLKLGWWDGLLKSLTGKSQELESLEIVGVPSDDHKDIETSKLAEEVFEKTKDTEKLRLACPNLVKFEMSILRARSFGRVDWIFDVDSGKWTGGITPGEGQNGDWTLVEK